MATLGRWDWDTGNAFTITYDVTHGLPCVTFMSTHPTVKPGQKFVLTEETYTEQLFADNMVIPLRIFLDLLHIVLSDDADNYLALYPETCPWTEYPEEVIKGLPVSSADVGCFHIVTYDDIYDTCKTKKT